MLARDLDTPVLAMSQLSRAVEQRHDKRPILSDLRESGCLTGDSRVFLPDLGAYVPISDLMGQEGVNVMALNEETWRMEPRRVLRTFSNGRKPVFTLVTRLGHTVRATGNHKFRALDGWRRLDDMAPGIRIALPLGMSSPLRHEHPAATAEVQGGVAQLISRSDTIATTGEVCWDEIVQLEPDGIEETYDLTVEGLHNFVANDVIVHNSIEQDADLVFFIYRDEYYNEESDQQGLAEVILAKHRNGPTGSEKLSFLKRYAKFADLAA